MTRDQADYCFILGAGGHAAVLVDAIRKSLPKLELRILDKNYPEKKDALLGIPIAGNDEAVAEPGAKSAWFAIGVGGVRSLTRRRELFDTCTKLGLRPLSVVHPGAVIGEGVRVGAGTQIFAGAIVNPLATTGENVIVNTAAVVEHECRIGSHSSISPGAVLCGGVSAGEGVFVGAGAVVLEGLSLGAGAFVAAGAVVTKNVPAGARVIGVPASRK